ncbi:MAG: hypothetical protein M3Z96_08255 [Pseudomonadota bacterium]|nr:hypothetical protein [Pseudomonadota bacterium]
MGPVSPGRFAARVRARRRPADAGTGDEAMPRARDTLRTEVNALPRRVLATSPWGGALTAPAFKSAVDAPARFTSEGGEGALRPAAEEIPGRRDRRRRRHRQGGDARVRGALYEARSCSPGARGSPRSIGWRWKRPSAAA